MVFYCPVYVLSATVAASFTAGVGSCTLIVDKVLPFGSTRSLYSSPRHGRSSHLGVAALHLGIVTLALDFELSRCIPISHLM
jgi:hypothetical protein